MSFEPYEEYPGWKPLPKQWSPPSSRPKAKTSGKPTATAPRSRNLLATSTLARNSTTSSQAQNIGSPSSDSRNGIMASATLTLASSVSGSRNSLVSSETRSVGTPSGSRNGVMASETRTLFSSGSPTSSSRNVLKASEAQTFAPSPSGSGNALKGSATQTFGPSPSGSGNALKGSATQTFGSPCGSRKDLVASETRTLFTTPSIAKTGLTPSISKTSRNPSSARCTVRHGDKNGNVDIFYDNDYFDQMIINDEDTSMRDKRFSYQEDEIDMEPVPGKMYLIPVDETEPDPVSSDEEGFTLAKKEGGALAEEEEGILAEEEGGTLALDEQEFEESHPIEILSWRRAAEILARKKAAEQAFPIRYWNMLVDRVEVELADLKLHWKMYYFYAFAGFLTFSWAFAFYFDTASVEHHLESWDIGFFSTFFHYYSPIHSFWGWILELGCGKSKYVPIFQYTEPVKEASWLESAGNIAVGMWQYLNGWD